jgi:hypothetical protein
METLDAHRQGEDCKIMTRPAKRPGSKKDRVPREEAPLSGIRLAPKLTAAIDKWAEAHGVSSRSEAIRRILELGLSASKPLRQRNVEAGSRALELAAQELDKLIDPSTPDEERKMRKRRLLRGPQEFRDIRGGISKQKR